MYLSLIRCSSCAGGRVRKSKNCPSMGVVSLCPIQDYAETTIMPSCHDSRLRRNFGAVFEKVENRAGGHAGEHAGKHAGEHARDGKGYMTSPSSAEGSGNLPITHYSGLGRGLFLVYNGPGCFRESRTIRTVESNNGETGFGT